MTNSDLILSDIILSIIVMILQVRSLEHILLEIKLCAQVPEKHRTSLMIIIIQMHGGFRGRAGEVCSS